MKKRRVMWTRMSGFLAATVLFSFCLSPLAAAQQATPTISVTVNKSMVFRLAERAKRVSVSQPGVADVVVVAPSQLLINGKAVGTTSLIVFNEAGDVANYDLIVLPDVAALRGQFRQLFPNEKIEISTSGSSLVLRGEVSNEVVYDKVLEIAQTYVPPKPPKDVAAPPTGNTFNVTSSSVRLPSTGTAFAGGGDLPFTEEPSMTDGDRWGDKRKIDGIIDLLTIKEVRQIELDVIVAEVSLAKLRDIGFDFSQTTNHTNSATFLGSQGGFGGILSGAAGGPASGFFRYVNGSYSLTSLYRMLQNKDVTEILAQPRLVMKNGRSGGFLAGGEFPVVQTTANTFEVEFKPFGVRLNFVPTLNWSDRIDLRVYPEVSEIDPAVQVNGVFGLRVRRTVNRVEMGDGESLVIAGLLDRRIFKDLTKFPLLGDIPILGTLFRSTRFRNSETELVFVITPRIVKTMKPGEKPQLPSLEKYDDPDIRQVPLPGTSEHSSVGRSAAPGATIP